MIRRRIFAVAAGILLSFSGIVSGHEALQNGFRNPPDSARPQCWWHWVDRKVTAQGIAADLKAMREFGFSTAHLFAVMGRPGSSEWPEIMSPAWRKLFCRAAEEARKNNIQLGMNNCPGWTCSGGPWIKPEDSMKKLDQGIFTRLHQPIGKVIHMPIQIPPTGSIRNERPQLGIFDGNLPGAHAGAAVPPPHWAWMRCC